MMTQTLLIFGIIGALVTGPTVAAVSTPTLLLEDVGKTNGESTFGTEWKYFSDRVMGGISDGKSGYVKTESGTAIRLEGTVKLDNNGGFIQVALPLKKRWSNLDASSYSGVRLIARGNGEQYAVHLRSNQTLLPWRYYSAEFETNGEWQTIEIPFDKFKPDSGNRPLNTKSLKRLGIVAAFKAMEAQLDVSKVELYR
jgi:hypothetical protein